MLRTARRDHRAWLAAAAGTIGLATGAMAQTIAEVEPNETKMTATVATFTTGGNGAIGSVTGTSTGSVTTAGLTSLDTFRLKMPAATPGIYRYTMVLNSTPAGHTGSIRGLDQITGGFINRTSDLVLQTSSTSTTPARANTWFGFGGEEELYYRVTGGAATVNAYSADLTRTTVTPTALAGPFTSGLFTITTGGQGHTTDTEFVLLGPDFKPYGTFRNDDEFGITGATSREQRVLVPGTYYLALSNDSVATSFGNSVNDDSRTDDVLDFPGALLNTSTTGSTTISFAITDGTGTTTPVAATKAVAYDVNFYSFTVVDSGNFESFGEAIPFNRVQGETVRLKVRVNPAPATTITGVTVDGANLGLGTINLVNVPSTDNWEATVTVTTGSLTGDVTVSYTATDSTFNTSSGTIDVNIFPAPPANDLCGGAFDLNSVTLPYAETFTNSAATDDVDIGTCNTTTPAASFFGVWYRWVSTGNGFLRVAESGTQTVAVGYFAPSSTVDPCANLGASLDCDDSQIAYVPVTNGQLVYVLVSNDSTTSSSTPVNVTFSFVPSPANDVCSGATLIENSDLPFVQDIGARTLTVDTATGCTTTNTFGAWYKYVATTSGSLELSIRATTPDTDYAIYRANDDMNPSCGDVTIVGTTCPTPTTTTPTLVPITPGTYYILAGDQAAAQARGDYTVGIDFLLPAVNDLCTGARSVPLTQQSFFVDDGRLGSDDADVSCNTSAATVLRRGLWYTFTTTNGGRLQIDETGSVDTTKQLYTSTDNCSTLTPVRCVTDESNALPLEPNSTYYLVIGPFNDSNPTAAYNTTFNFQAYTGACCVGASCSVTTESDCASQSGTYSGDYTSCVGSPQAIDLEFLDLPEANEAGTPDVLGVLTRPLTVTQTDVITKVEVEVDFSHPFSGHTSFILVGPAPSNTTISLHDRIGGTSATPTCPVSFTGAFNSDDLNGIYRFTDLATTSIAAQALVTGGPTVIPSGQYLATGCPSSVINNLNAAFAGQTMNGTWTLIVQDHNEDTLPVSGVLRSWRLILNDGLTISCGSPCPLNFDDTGGSAGLIDLADLNAFFDAWGAANGTPCAGPCPLNFDDTGGSAGLIDLADLNAFFDAWGAANGTPCP